jgi:hypothetical protein
MSHEYSTEYILPNGDMTFSLSEYVQANVDAERERIIKLLESDLCGGGKPALSDDIHCDHDEQTLHLIALIKGLEKKNEELLANPYYPSPYFTVIDEFDRDVFKLTAIEWEKLNIELDKD